LFFLNWLARYLEDQKVKSPQIWWTLHHEKLHCTYPRTFQLLQNGMHIANQVNKRLRQSWAGIWNPL
jgi:hypothetical protein